MASTFPSFQHKDFAFLVDVDQNGELRYNEQLIQSAVLSKNSTNCDVTMIGIVDNVVDSSSYYGHVIEAAFRDSMKTSVNVPSKTWSRTVPHPVSAFENVRITMSSTTSGSRAGVIIRKVPVSPDISSSTGRTKAIFVLYLWMGTNSSYSEANTKMYTKLTDFVCSMSSVVVISHDALSRGQEVYQHDPVISVMSSPRCPNFNDSTTMILLLRCDPNYIWLSPIAELRNVKPPSSPSQQTSIIECLNGISNSLGNAAKRFANVIPLVGGYQSFSYDVSYRFQPSDFGIICGVSSQHPVEAETIEQLVVRLVEIHNALLSGQALPPYVRNFVGPTSNLTSKFVPFYKKFMFKSAQVDSLSKCHQEAVAHATQQLSSKAGISQLELQELLYPEVVILEQEVYELDRKLEDKLQDLETNFAISLLQDPQKMTAQSLETIIKAGEAALIHVIKKFGASHLKGVSTVFIEMRTSILRKLATSFEEYVASMKTLLTDRVFMTQEELSKQHRHFFQQMFTDTTKPLYQKSPMVVALVKSAIESYFICCTLENAHKRKTAETLLTGSSSMLFQAYKTMMTEALDRSVFTPEHLSKTHEIAAASAMRAFNNLRPDVNASIWDSYAQKAKTLIATEFSLFEEMNQVNAFEVQQQGETIVESALKSYKDNLGNKRLEEDHTSAKKKALLAFDTAVVRLTRREAVQMWRQKLVAGINAHYASIAGPSGAGKLPDGFLKLKSSDKPQSAPAPAEPTVSRRRDLDNALKRVGAKLSTTGARSAVVAQVKKVVQSSTEVLNRRDASDAEIDVAVRKLELWEKSLDKSNT